MGVICVFGDSNEWGAWDTELGGWVNRLRLWLDKRCFSEDDFYYETYNLGINGNNSDNLLSRIEGEASARNPDIILIDIGSNDSANPESDNAVTLEDYKNNLSLIIDSAKSFTDKVAFLSLLPVDEKRTKPVEWDKNVFFTNKRISDYNDVLLSVCKNRGIEVIGLSSVSINDSPDGLHLSSKGHEAVFHKVKDFLTGKKWL
ncbi:MAG: GDSL-type esterase/lipase family protein [Nanoarchaeota archaeon]